VQVLGCAVLQLAAAAASCARSVLKQWTALEYACLLHGCTLLGSEILKLWEAPRAARRHSSKSGIEDPSHESSPAETQSS